MKAEERDLVDRLRELSATEGPIPDFVSGPEGSASALDGAYPEDIAIALVRLSAEERVAALMRLDPETAAYVLIELPTETARTIVSGLSDATLAHYLDVLPMDDALELREEIGAIRFEALLGVIPTEDAQEIRRLQSYPEDSAGQLMTEDFLSVPPEANMENVLRAIRESDERIETVNTIYVLSSDRHLLGVLTLRRVLRADPAALAREVMNPDPVAVPVSTPEESVARTLAKYGFTALPILDTRGRMVGIVTADDAQDILEEAQTEDVLALGAVTGDAEAYPSLGVIELAKRRLPWLLILFLAEFFTGTVLRYYLRGAADNNAPTASAILARLTIFMPLLIGAGGNAGSQVTTTITRALALGEVRSRDWLLVIRREFAVALLCGLVLGTIGYLRAIAPFTFLGGGQPPYIAITVGLALPCIVVWAATVGSLLPIAAKRLGLDPAVMSAPFITTFVDATGLIIYFEIALHVLAQYNLRF